MSATNMQLTKFEEAYAFLAMVMEDVGHLVPSRAVVEYWLEANEPVDGYLARLAALSVPRPSTRAVAAVGREDVPDALSASFGEYPPIPELNRTVSEARR